MAIVAGCAIQLCYCGHELAHFDAVAPDGVEVQVRVTDSVIIKGDLPA